jgi:hypothetical protein
MTRENIEKMALKVGAHEGSPCDECGEVNPLWQFGTEELWQFAWHIAAAESNACALIAESYEPRCDTCPSGVTNAIRARWGNPDIKWGVEP